MEMRKYDDIVAFLLLTLVLYGGVFPVDKFLLNRDVKFSSLAAFTGSKYNTVIPVLPVRLVHDESF